MATRSRGGNGSPNDTPTVPLKSCPSHPGVLTSGSCPACQRGTK
ncbi:hypothetical protein [Sphaerisporangium dianthi]|uniref:Uncharacterized protein n=1 Tax=Sphaerisporangium dianthi TaxID=1436120 RepID=A0ABV9CW73_9ACTN